MPPSLDQNSGFVCLLPQAVRDSGDTAPTATVEIDTLTFDRVLIFLEAYALKRKPPRFAVHLLGDLQEVRHASATVCHQPCLWYFVPQTLLFEIKF
jgi:hypothetical protein